MASCLQRQNGKRGFTYIELLVTVAIIGTLSAVVLVSVRTAQLQSADAAIEANLATVQVQAEVFFDTNTNPGYKKSYGPVSATGACSSLNAATVFMDPTIQIALANVAKIVGSSEMECNSDLSGYTTAQAYAIQVKMASSAKVWCIDSRGFSGLRSGPINGAFKCPDS
ncbi:MAG: type II secretion system protein [Patescibacteria group bacterium]